MVSHPIYVVLGVQPTTSHMLNEHYIIWATNSAILPITNLLRKKSGKINHIHSSFQKGRKKGNHNPTQHHHAGRRRFSWLGTRPPLSPMPRGRVSCPQNTWWGHLQGPPDETTGSSMIEKAGQEWLQQAAWSYASGIVGVTWENNAFKVLGTEPSSTSRPSSGL